MLTSRGDVSWAQAWFQPATLKFLADVDLLKEVRLKPRRPGTAKYSRPTIKIWDYGTVVPRPTIMTRYRWALEPDEAK